MPLQPKTLEEKETSGIHLLVIDDDTRLRRLLREFLTGCGFSVSQAAGAEEARQLLKSMEFDLLIVDIMMPGETGLEFAKELRKTNPIPMLMLTARGSSEDRIQGLEAGVDDYMPKPFEPRELHLRINNILRRAADRQTIPHPHDTDVKFGNYTFDAKRLFLFRDGELVRLTSSESQLLKVLSARQGLVTPRDVLVKLCAISGGERAIDVLITRLRRKIEPDMRTPRYLLTHRGRGYTLQQDS